MGVAGQTKPADTIHDFSFPAECQISVRTPPRQLTIFPSDNLLRLFCICSKAPSELPAVTVLFCREGSLAMFSWMSKDETRVKHGDIYEGVAEGLKGIYK